MEYGQIHHVEYYVNDLEATKSFWGWFLSRMGYVEYQSWDQGISYVHANQTYLVFVEVEPQYRQFVNSRQAPGLNHIAFKGSHQQELDSLAEELKQRKMRILKQREGAICFEDSNQFAIEVFC